MQSPTARLPFDPELEAILATVGDQIPNVTLETIEELRRAPAPGVVTDDQLAAAGLVRRDVTIPGYEGVELLTSVISRKDKSGIGPGIYHTHGGGMIVGNRMAGISQIMPWIVAHDAVAVTVEYRIAPEFPDPYPVEDCYAGLLWTAEHADELGIDLNRLIIAGTSAGGGLAAGNALMARDRSGPRLAGQVLMCPMLDDRDQTASSAQWDTEGIWIRSSNVTGWTALLGDRRATDGVSIYAAPARATDLTGLPPAYIDCGSAEVFRDEDVAYAMTLWSCGVQAELHVWPGGFHGFDLIAPHTALAQTAIAVRNNWVAKLFDK
ncbi:alpha/beta hydrolase [Mycolicibacterium fortuitum]|uniref:Alpha/beta hydrolase domain-containing protein n=1 Tax=Mycolicibacterium fortuitum subsp. fortuitum DSM 46621 = ATCC 6841 = JCM 6387 TaxID=1214102 RepID=K0VLF1_MYCFO|nr:alpha/beta hydrolase [Mycolicibacterium fortuitum]AIY48014.1 alpha/beta hydrolase domain protein [Mycobacterium sp. VKM Ac-1817D]CRL74163.1 lipase [Mycolicibacter nonchromogenicus]EJZ11914.1 alpha/beta hydrolase domain-containing protein [Mycolicibacterium fortuitum subsp. fortuitum DSM 46621 = ATCC 6841 = JCM 6387]MBP3086570.1 alpha/beta hydrolase [Mycolicibacterium fortuitum]WEV31622.1 alpha/beta hydrolase [Mycolicibacterium fortuitum]